MDDYEETRLYEPDPKPSERKTLWKRYMRSWVFYCAIVAAVVFFYLYLYVL